MQPLIAVIIVCAVALIAAHLWLLAQQSRIPNRPPETASAWPRTMVVLPLRGGDPFLADCLQRLANLDYPDYSVRVVVDSAEDPALSIAHRFLEESGSRLLSISILKQRQRYCSSKISALLQATESIPEGCQIVLLVDGDSVLHATCLREMVRPLSDPAVSVTSGQRWYAPEVVSLTAMTRSIWNGFANAAMRTAGIPWGGCLAMRVAMIRDPELRDQLAHAFADDCTIGSFVHACRGRVLHVPEATLINREDVSWRGLLNFVVRQALCVRVQKTRWPLMAGYALWLNLTVIGLVVSLALSSSCQAPIAISFFGLLAVTVALVLSGDRACHYQAMARNEAWPPYRLDRALLWPVALFGANTLSLVGVLIAAFLWKHTWRGITYRFGNPPVELVQVIPFQTARPREVALASVE